MDNPAELTAGATAPLPSDSAISVVIVVDVCLYREGLARTLSQSEGISVAGTAEDVERAGELIEGLRPSVVLLDPATDPEGALVRRILGRFPETRIVALGIREVEDDVLHCARAGMTGYVPRDGSISELVSAVESAARGELRCSPRIAASLFHRVARMSEEQERATASTLTPREQEILSLIDAGMSNKQISRRLSIEVPTVKNHVHNLLQKLKTSRRDLAAARANTPPR